MELPAIFTFALCTLRFGCIALEFRACEISLGTLRDDALVRVLRAILRVHVSLAPPKEDTRCDSCCTGCGECMEVCPADAFVEVDVS